MRRRRNYAALLIAAAIAFQGGIPAYADDTVTRTITIYADKEASQSHTYEAYRIFKGDYTETSDSTGTFEKILSNIAWDEDFDSGRMTELLLWSSTFAPRLARAEGEESGVTAEEVAAMLEELTADEAIEFAALAAQCLPNACDGIAIMNEGLAEAEISVTGDGYYLIKDQDGSLTGAESDAATFFLLTVAGDAAVKTKSDWPSLTKKIVDTGMSHGGLDTDLVDTNEAAVGDRVTYELNATIPSMLGYESYTFILHDRLSEGLTLDPDSIQIYLDGDGDFLTTMTGNGVNAISDQQEITSEAEFYRPADEKGGFDLEFKDFISHASDAGKHIIVRFEATVNDNAVVGEEGNPNAARLEFSNYPGQKSTGTTPEDTVITYVSGLDILKLDANDSRALSGAEFVLYMLDENGNKTAGRINRVKDNEEEGYFQFSFTQKDDGGLETHTFVSDTEGKISIRGLRAGNYVLEEVKAPAGYNSLLSPISLNLSWTGEDEVDNGAEKAVWTFGAYGDGLGSVDGVTTTDLVKCENGIVLLRVLNNKGVVLPQTGGAGVAALYAGGILLMLLLLLGLNRKKKANEEQA